MTGTQSPPKWIAWEITGRCNLHCVHCRSSSDMGEEVDSLSLETSRGMIDDIASFASPVLVLSGGEPLLREDCFQLARYGTEKGLRVCLATNGTLVDEHVCQEIRASGIKIVSLSLDGSTPAIHDDFRQQAGAYEGVMRAVEHFHRHGIEFIINSSFTRRNQDDIENVFHLARKLRAKAWYMFMIVPTGRGGDAVDELIGLEDYERILQWHYDQERQEPDILMRPTCAPNYYRVTRERSRLDGDNWKRRSLQFGTGVDKGCLAGQHIAFIDRLGDVRPCSYFEQPAGNVLKQSFKDIWENSELFAQLRDPGLYEGKCGRCEYLKVCGGCRARAGALSEGDFLAEEPFCSYQPRPRSNEAGETGAASGVSQGNTGKKNDSE